MVRYQTSIKSDIVIFDNEKNAEKFYDQVIEDDDAELAIKYEQIAFEVSKKGLKAAFLTGFYERSNQYDLPIKKSGLIKDVINRGN